MIIELIYNRVWIYERRKFVFKKKGLYRFVL